MSGFISILNHNHIPVLPDIIEHFTNFMKFLGPDTQDTWCQGSIGMGIAQHWTTREAHYERQPFSLDGDVWIVADARLDDRLQLIAQLRAAGRPVVDNALDLHLILHAYYAWGEASVQRLLGDFAFVIWDERTEQLFCARDQLGVANLYYARTEEGLLVSNVLNCIRQHPEISPVLDEAYLADHLLFSYNLEQDTTPFLAIHKVPPAHVLFGNADGIQIKQYWSFKEAAEVRYRRQSDYIEHFQDLLHKSVADRLRMEQVAIFMSGGLGSSSIAATVAELAQNGDVSCDLHAFTTLLQHLVPERQDGAYAAATARALNIPIDYHVTDDYLFYQNWGKAERLRPEPTFVWPRSVVDTVDVERAIRHSPIILAGFGSSLFNQGPQLRFEKFSVSGSFRNLTNLFTNGLKKISSQLLQMRPTKKSLHHSMPHPAGDFPIWLNPALVERFNLRERWQYHLTRQDKAARMGIRNDEAILQDPIWANQVFRWYDAEVTHLPVKMRYPFLDLRLIEYLRAIPTTPWLQEQYLLRSAMENRLPDRIRRRAKVAANVGSTKSYTAKHGLAWTDRFSRSETLVPYVDRIELRQQLSHFAGNHHAVNARIEAALNLACWLENQKDFTQEYYSFYEPLEIKMHTNGHRIPRNTPQSPKPQPAATL